MADVYKNVARDDASVIMQIGVVNDGVHTGSPAPAALRAEVAGLRRDLRSALTRGEVSAAKFAAAQEQLEEVDASLADTGSGARERLLGALRRLKDLVAGAADLGAKIAIIVKAIHGLP